jgi:hypothetical protein
MIDLSLNKSYLIKYFILFKIFHFVFKVENIFFEELISFNLIALKWLILKGKFSCERESKKETKFIKKQ